MAGESDHTWVDSMPAAYERGLEGPVFAPFAAELARRVAAHGPARVLEVAAGTGVATRAVADAVPGVDILATDLNPAMVEHGRRREPRARWEQADGAHLPAGDGAVDVVYCGFGAMFFPDRVAAYREARRVLVPGGRVLLTIWDALDAHEWERALTAGLEDLFPGDAPPFLAAVPHGYADPERIGADLRAGGFGDVRVERVVVEGTADSAAAVAEGYCTGTPLRAQILERLPGSSDPGTDHEAALGETARRVGDTMTAHLGAGRVTARMAAYVAEGRRPG